MIRRLSVVPNLNFNVEEMRKKTVELIGKGKQLVTDHPVATAAGTAATVGILIGRNLFKARQ